MIHSYSKNRGNDSYLIDISRLELNVTEANCTADLNLMFNKDDNSYKYTFLSFDVGEKTKGEFIVRKGFLAYTSSLASAKEIEYFAPYNVYSFTIGSKSYFLHLDKLIAQFYYHPSYSKDVETTYYFDGNKSVDYSLKITKSIEKITE